MSELLKVTLQVLPSNERRQLELPSHATGEQIINAILNENVVPRTDDTGNPHSYKLMLADSSWEIGNAQKLYELKVNNGDTLLLVPKLIAG